MGLSTIGAGVTGHSAFALDHLVPLEEREPKLAEKQHKAVYPNLVINTTLALFDKQ